jgi:hypothetical protein
MSLIYEDALREDQDLCKLLQAIRIAEDPKPVATNLTLANSQPLEVPRPKNAIVIVDDNSDGGLAYPNSAKYWQEYNTETESRSDRGPSNSDASTTGHDDARE